ncbi:MAG: hypothetical protein NC131_16805, partial [Roseburia sp.]|nr:hypothetical protein [Roseburia sp.]
NPPPFCDVYLLGNDALVYIREYSVKDNKIEVLHQQRFAGNLITVFSQGGVYLSIDGAEYSLKALPLSFKQMTAQEFVLGGRQVYALNDKKRLIVISESGKIVYMNAASDFEFSDTLKVTADFETCTAAQAVCEYSYDGEKLTLLSADVKETRPPERDIIPFAFFESALVGADFGKYLCDELKAKAHNLKSYLGEYVSVTVPPEKFYLEHGEINAAGLVYPKGKNLYEVKFFAVDLEGDKIANVYPVDG